MEILGLLDSLESTILDGFKIPMTKKTLINEEQVLILIDKIRLVAQGGADFVKKAIDKDRIRSQAQDEVISTSTQRQSHAPTQQSVQPPVDIQLEMKIAPEKAKAAEIVDQAYQIAKEVREGADKYADEILSNLELTSSRILRTVKAGRERLQKNVQGSGSSEDSNV